ncbi:MAG: methyltransferase domain-containing protein [Candidatus Omnitrophota bacterium]|nr:methyltransferase domain-containing protein [Candidatus Omnitrophota bacterium]
MFWDVIDQKIRRAFSNAAIQYDILSDLHKEIGRDLIKKMLKVEGICPHILDVGMGTGWLTQKIAFYFPESKVIGLDFASGMVDVAKKNVEEVRIIQADAGHLPFADQSFDMIVSNLAYQWVAPLPTALEEGARCLKSPGRIFFSVFGHETFRELFESLNEAALSEQKPLRRLLTRAEWEGALKDGGFSSVEVKEERIKVHFPTVRDLLYWIKNIGANALAHDVVVGKEWLERAEEYYNQHYKDRFGIYATFEVLWVEGQK